MSCSERNPSTVMESGFGNSGRRLPPGVALQAIMKRRPAQRGGRILRSVSELDPVEYGEQLRVEGASERFIAKELATLREMQAQDNVGITALEERRKQRRNRQLEDETLDPYVEAEVRRTAGVVAEDVLKSMQTSSRRD